LNQRKFIISDYQQDLIRVEAVLAFPRECCGLLVGYGEFEIRVTRVVPTLNMAERADRFLVDPQVQFELIRSLRGTNKRLVGHYHSHPKGDARPSQYDEDMAFDRELVWFIMPVKESSGGEGTAYVYEDVEGKFQEISMFSRDAL